MTNEQKREFISYRRAVIEKQFGHLNDMQREAALKTQGPLLLLAGAGSGKTTVLISRIENLLVYGSGSDSDIVPEDITETDLAFLRLYCENLENEALRQAGAEKAKALCQVMPAQSWQILAITFTNKAAGELKERLEARLGDGAKDIWAMTFHAACVRILRRYIDRIGYDRGFTIYDMADVLSLIKRILADLNLDEKTYAPRKILGEISRAKDNLQDAATYETIAEKSGDYRKQKTALVYLEYEKRLKAAQAVDFDDLLFLTVRLLQKDEGVRNDYARQFRYILIDEYQDTNNLQYLFASLLAQGHQNICVVGDDDQSIYKFRGATIQNILNFEEQYKGAKTIRLEQNYRSSGHILEAANAVIANNEGRKGKKLWTQAGMGEKITHHIARDQMEEANYVAQRILEDFGQGGSFLGHAVLYRMSALAREMELAFKRNGIPYKVFGGMSFFDAMEIKDILAYMAAVSNPADDLRLTRIINVPARGIGGTTVEHLREISLRQGKPISAILDEVNSHESLKRAAAKLAHFGNLLASLRQKAQSLPLDEFYDHLLEDTGYLRMLREKPEENAARIEHIEELKSNIVNYLGQNPEGDLRGFLEEIALYTDLEEAEEGAETVTLMTMHSAKGLEFDHVYLVGQEEGIFPGHRSIGEVEEMEEERRLCYVAITRAKKKLHMISASQRMLFGRTTANMPTRFLEEIPEDYKEQTGNVRASYQNTYGQNSRGETSHWTDDFAQRHPNEAQGMPQRGASTYEKSPRRAMSLPTAPPGAHQAFARGDQISHTAFGKGQITQITPVGGDVLAEIAFEEVGSKRLMLKAAAAHMKKL